MRNFSYAVDVFIFFVLLYVFDMNWWLALGLSWLAGGFIRAVFATPEAPATQTTGSTPEGAEAGPGESVD